MVIVFALLYFWMLPIREVW